MNAEATATHETTSAPAAVVFGRDNGGKPHAAWFEAGEAELAEKAAGLMGMRFTRLDGEGERALAAQLPRGRVFASGRAFTPFVGAALFDRLAALGGAAGADGAISVTRPASRAKRPPTGSPRLKSAGATAAKRGDTDRAAAGEGSPPPTKAEGEGTNNMGDETGAEPCHSPRSWDNLRTGSLVLVSEDEQSWWAAVVVETKPDDLFVVRWRDWPQEPVLVRRREHLGLLHPDHPQP
jgi:hypothetical protein